MSVVLKIIIIIIALLLLVDTIRMVKKNNISIRYSLIWFLSSLVLLTVALFPNFFNTITKLIGFEVSSNLVIGIFIVLLLIITRMLTKVVSEQSKKITLLIQEISILKSRDGEKK